MRKRLEDYFPAYFRKMYEEQRKSGEISEMRVHLGGMVTWVSQGKKYITPGQQPLGQEEFGRLLSGLYVCVRRGNKEGLFYSAGWSPGWCLWTGSD